MPKQVTLKGPTQFKLIGKPVRRLDILAKLHGTALYGIDTLLPGLLYASITLCPTLGGTVTHFDATVARTLPGVRKIVALDPVPGGLAGTGSTSGGVAVIAETPFQAMRAHERLTIDWNHGAAARISSESIAAEMARVLDTSPGKVHMERGGAAAALASAAKMITAEYHVPLLAHATMEPMNCTAQFKDGVMTVWAATQAMGMARAAISKALRIDATKIDVHVPFLGGGFGRRYFSDVCVQAAMLARQTDGAPVQLIWSREQDMAHDYYRPAYISRGQAGFDSNGRLIAWLTTSAGSSLGAPSLLDAATDGASNTAYAFPTARVAHQTVELPLTLGIWRSVHHSQNAFFTESFIDECAVAAGQDCVTFRASLLAGNDRHLRVLLRAAELANWGQATPSESDGIPRGRGIAIHRGFGSVVAQVAEVSIDTDRQIRVHGVVCAARKNHARQRPGAAEQFSRLSAAADS